MFWLFSREINKIISVSTFCVYLLTMMRCHYDVLEVRRDADETEIKTAYKKMALRWHPDKNIERVEEAKEQFQLVQQAYEVLSDRQERAWYDNHREQILRTTSDAKKENLNLFNVFPYFTTTCFRGYEDVENGFYAVYKLAFDSIAAEDLSALDIDDKEDFLNIPTFGNSTSDYEEIVNPFYRYWLQYNTRNTYSWLDERVPKEVRNRRIFKLIEKENKKVRAKARKERNDEVRSLVEFVRKRDKRVQANIIRVQERAEESRRKQEQLCRERRLEQRRSNLAEEQAEWTKFHNVREQLEDIERTLGTDSDDDDVDCNNSSSDESSVRDCDHMLCIACNKLFKTQKAFENHEKSRKHQENVAMLKDVLQQDEDAILQMDNDAQSDANGFQDDRKPDDAVTYSNTSMSDRKTKQRRRNKVLSTIDTDQDLHGSGANEAAHGQYVSIHPTEETVKTKKKRRREKDRTQPEENASNSYIPSDGDKVSNNNGNESYVCIMCKNLFTSNNKLFAHLKKTGHAKPS